MDYAKILREVGMKNYLPGDTMTKEGQEKMLAAVADVIDAITPYKLHAEMMVWNREVTTEMEFKEIVGEVAYKVNELIAIANIDRLKSDIIRLDNSKLMQAWIVLDFYAYILKSDFTINIVNMQKLIAEVLFSRGFMVEENNITRSNSVAVNNVSTSTTTIVEQEINKLEKRKKVFGIVTIVCVCAFAISLLISNLTRDQNKDVPYEKFNKNGAENVYTAVEIDFLAPISESYYYNESTGAKDYSRTDYYCLFGSSKSEVHGIVKLEHDEYYDDRLKDIVAYSENENDTTPPESIMIYGDTEKFPSYVNQHFFEEVGFGSGYDLGDVCIDGKFTPTKEMSPFSIFLMIIGVGSVYPFIGFLIAFLVTNSNIKKKKRLLNVL